MTKIKFQIFASKSYTKSLLMLIIPWEGSIRLPQPGTCSHIKAYKGLTSVLILTHWQLHIQESSTQFTKKLTMPTPHCLWDLISLSSKPSSSFQDSNAQITESGRWMFLSYRKHQLRLQLQDLFHLADPVQSCRIQCLQYSLWGRNGAETLL